MTGEAVRIDWEHHEVHDGDTFQAWVVNTSLGDTESINIAFKTPPATTKQIHMIIEWDTKAGGYIEVLNGATWTAKSGTIFVPVNANGNSANTSSILGNETTTVFTANEVAYGVTTILTTVASTQFKDYRFGSANKTPSTRAMEEIILEGGKTYVIRFTAIGATNAGFIKLRWYEYLPNVIG